MSKNDKQRVLVPRLRFPEFRDAPGWEYKELGEIVTSISNGISLTQGAAISGVKVTRIETISESRIDLSKVGYVETDEDISAYKLAVGDILLSNINSVDHIGKSVLVDRDYDLYHGMNLLRLVVDSRLASPQFVFLALNTDETRSSIRARANKAVNQASINQTELGRTLVAIPQLAEQQKIADCLSPLDELIAAEGRKLAALRDHKKGLMQQLFPREGETRPRLRFPEFRDAGEWKKEKLSSLCELYQPEPLAASELIQDGAYLVYGANGIIGKCNRYNHEDSEVIVTCRGATCGEVHRTIPKSWITSNAMVVKPKDDRLSRDFVFYFLKSNGLKSVVSGSAQPQITRIGLAPLALHIPHMMEQQRIADCLSSLDALITAQAEKLDALRSHKRGLMQQLFPAPEEVGA